MKEKTMKALNAELVKAGHEVLDGFNLGRYQAVIFEGEDPDGSYYGPVERLGQALAELKERSK